MAKLRAVLETPGSLKVCGKCIHTLPKGTSLKRMLSVAEDSAHVLIEAGPVLSPQVIKALADIAQAYEWKCRCTLERITVRVLEPGCCHWQESSGCS